MSAAVAVIELAGEAPTPVGADRRVAILLASTLFLSVASAFVGRDGPTELAPPVPPLALPAGIVDVTLFTFPDRLANEAAPAFLTDTVTIRSTQGLANVPSHSVQMTMVTWTERGTAYWLMSERKDVADLVRLANTLR